MKQWDEIWPEVESILFNGPADKQSKLTRICALKGQKVTWEAVQRAKRRLTNTAKLALLETLDTLKLPLVKVKKPGKQTTVLEPRHGDIWAQLNDIHFGIEDKRALKAALRCARVAGINRLILAGDIFDCYSLSRYDHTPFPKREVYTIEDEAKRAEWFWDEVSNLSIPVDLMPGNHEDRIWSLEKNNPGLVNGVSLRTMFGIPDFVQVHEQNSRLLAGDLVVEHGHKLPGSLSTNGAAKVLRDHPYQHTVYGHTHRVETRMHTVHMPDGSPRTFGAYSLGHLSVAEHHIDYSPDSSWQQGFGLIHWRQVGDRMVPTVESVVILDGGFVAAGMEYSL
jgi:predicted phosphodiesterase